MRLSLRWRLTLIMGLGGLAAAGVGWVTSQNPTASPAHFAVALRVAIILMYAVTAAYAHTSEHQARMGSVLVGLAAFSTVWLLNGSADPLLFSFGLLFTGLAVPLVAYLMLSHPAGRLRSPTDRRFLWRAGGAFVALWLLAVVTTRQPPLKTPLLQCAPHCPHTVISLGWTTSPSWTMKAALTVAWLTLVCGTPVLLSRRTLSGTVPMRHALIPVCFAAVANAVVFVAYRATLAGRLPIASVLGGAYLATGVMVPMALLVGLAMERLFVAQALAEFVLGLDEPRADPEALMASAVHDPSLTIAYYSRSAGTYVNAHGAPVTAPAQERSTTWIQKDGRPVAAVTYDRELAGQDHFMRAAGTAAKLRLEQRQLEADLKAAGAELEAARARLVETAYSERRRLERDLHDGVQQHLVGLRIKLDLAADAIKDDPVAGERTLRSAGRQMDDVLDELRALARGIYPSVLHEYGVGAALESAARNSPLPVVVRAHGVPRFDEGVEVAVYFCCLEALQNAAKHGGRNAGATVTLWHATARLCFEVRDSGVGFDARRGQRGSGLGNMRDRIEATGGRLEIVSQKGHGTSVRGCVPSGTPLVTA